MPRRPSLARRLTTATRWPVGIALTSWTYMWRTTPLHRTEEIGGHAARAPPPPAGGGGGGGGGAPAAAAGGGGSRGGPGAARRRGAVLPPPLPHVHPGYGSDTG